MNGDQNLRERRAGTRDGPTVDGQANLKEKEEEGEVFPLGLALKILGVAVVIFTVIPYYGFTTPAAPRTDIPWWRSGFLYKVDIASIHEAKLESLAALGVTGIKLEGIKSLQPSEEERNVINDLKQKGFSTIITLDGKKNQASLLLSGSKLWLDNGADGISIEIASGSGAQIKNITLSLRKLADNYEEDQEFVLVMVETSSKEDLDEALAGGADLVTGPQVCSASSGQQLSSTLKTVLSDETKQDVYAWQSCPASSTLQLLPVMLPGTVIFSQSDLSFLQKEVQSLLKYKKWPSLLWGKFEKVHVTDSVYSFLRWANGKIYDKVALISNVGDSTSTENYVIRLSRFSVPAKGIVLVSSSNKYKVGEVVKMENLEVEKGASLIVHFPPFGV